VSKNSYSLSRLRFGRRKQVSSEFTTFVLFVSHVAEFCHFTEKQQNGFLSSKRRHENYGHRRFGPLSTRFTGEKIPSIT